MNKEKRIYGIDALRAIAMILGIFLHSSIAYKVHTHRNWIHDEQFNSLFFDFIYSFIHSFRMPVFFVIGGFFCRLLYYKVGIRQFIFHRWKRVGLPFIIALIVIVPLSLFPYNLYIYHYKLGLDLKLALDRSMHRLLKFNGLAHLWFLYYLLLYYAVVLLYMQLKKMSIINAVAGKIFFWLKNIQINRIHWIIIVCLLVWTILLPEKDIFPITDTYLFPKRIHNLILYGYLFGLGWIFHIRMDIFTLLVRKFQALLFSGIVISLFIFYSEWQIDYSYSKALHLILKALAGCQMVFLTFGFMGFFLSYFKTENRFWRYVSDASYWIYLLHLGIVISMQLILLNSPVPGILRFPLVFIVALLLTLITYHYCVRYTFIGAALHGVRKRKMKVIPHGEI